MIVVEMSNPKRGANLWVGLGPDGDIHLVANKSLVTRRDVLEGFPDAVFSIHSFQITAAEYDSLIAFAEQHL